MKIKSLLVQIRPRCFARWRSLPLFGPLLDDFLRWMHDQHYTDSTLDSHLAGLRKVVVWLGRRRITTLAQLTQKDLQAAHDHFLPSQRKAGSAIGCNPYKKSLIREKGNTALIPTASPGDTIFTELGRSLIYGLRPTILWLIAGPDQGDQHGCDLVQR